MSKKKSRRAAKKGVATAADYAVLSFEPWKHTADEWTPPSNEEWLKDSAELLPLLRAAWILMFKTKAELEKISRDLNNGDVGLLNETIDRMSYARQYFRNVITVVEVAEARMISAVTSVLAKDDPEEFARA